MEMRKGAAKHDGDEANDLESKGVRWRLPWAARVVTRSLEGDDDVTLSTQGMRSILSMVSISPEGFLPSILLLVVIIVTVVIVVVTVILVVVVVKIIGVVVVVMIIGVVGVVVVSSIIKLCSRAILIGQEPFQFSPGYLVGLLYSNRFGIGIPPGQGILGESTSSKFHFAVLGTVATRKYRFSSFKPTNETNSSFRTIEVERLATHKLFLVLPEQQQTYQQRVIGWSLSHSWFLETGSLPSGYVDLTGDEDPTDEDGDIGMGDSTGVSASLGGEIFSRGKKCQESNIGDSDNTRDGGKIVGGAIRACGGIGERASEAKRSLVKSSEKLGEVFPGEAGK
ncbi:hypothetical protein Tco_0001908 [Tanacetum coccineum]